MGVLRLTLIPFIINSCHVLCEPRYKMRTSMSGGEMSITRCKVNEEDGNFMVNTILQNMSLKWFLCNM